MAGAVQHGDSNLTHLQAKRLADVGEVGLDRRFDVYGVGGAGADGDLVHVEDVGGDVHGVAGGEGDGGDGPRHALGEERGAIYGVNGDVHSRVGAVADALADVEHGGFVLLALADYDDAVHADTVQRVAHGVDGGLVDHLLVAKAHVAGCGHGGGLGNSDELHGKVAFDGLSGSLCHRVIRPPVGCGREKILAAGQLGCRILRAGAPGTNHFAAGGMEACARPSNTPST